MSVAYDTDAGLWDLLTGGDEKAYSTLFRKYYASLVNYGKSLTAHHNLVPDCVQEVFLDVWLYRENLSVPLSVKAYLLSGVRKRIARKLERDHIFKNSDELHDGRVGYQVEFHMNFTVLDELILDEDSRKQVNQLNRLLNQLPARQKEALYLRYYQGLDIDQIAKLMDVNPQSVSNLLHRGIRHLRRSGIGEISLLFIAFNFIC